MNFSSTHLEDYFFNDDYIIQTVKSIGVFEPKLWKETFKKSLTRNIVEAKILHTSSGLALPIKRYAVSPHKQTLEFAGLHAYNDKSKLLSELLHELLEHIQDETITRLDIAIDYKGKIPNKVIKKLCEDRVPFRYWNTTYYKSKSEKKSNNRLNIKSYSKSNKEKLSQDIERLEFSFLSSYLGKVKVKELEKLFKKMAKTIKRFSGLDVKILYL
ncbi:hypothetical protein [Sulfurimonas sp.]|uniref:hypothetical protein n=1 Tax=Sulfurimonas sp. TaxID=2022749 RepID=UPI0039E274E8